MREVGLPLRLLDFFFLMVKMDHEGKFHCSSCGFDKERDKFRWRKIKGIWYKAHCLDCTSFYRKDYHSENKKRASDTHAKLRSRKIFLPPEEAILWWAARHINQWRLKSERRSLPPVDLDKSYISDIFHLQDGKCYYGGTVLKFPVVGMKHAAFDPDLISLDRKTPNLGYVKGNVVLCSFLMNTTKGPRTELEFLDVCRNVLDRFGAAR